jgi:hypothetical protein
MTMQGHSCERFPHTESIEVINILKKVNGPSMIPYKCRPASIKEPGSMEITTFVNHYAPDIFDRLGMFTPFKLIENEMAGLQ